MSELCEKVGHRLKVLRAEARMTQEDLASASGLSVDSIRTYERGISAPRLETTVALAEALGCTPNDICGWGK